MRLIWDIASNYHGSIVDLFLVTVKKSGLLCELLTPIYHSALLILKMYCLPHHSSPLAGLFIPQSLLSAPLSVSLSDLFDDDSARLLSQYTLQAGQSVCQRFCGWVGIQISLLEALPG